MKKSILLVLLMVTFGFFLVSTPASATSFTWNFNYEFSGGTHPEGPAPWLTATFTDELDGHIGQLLMILKAGGLVENEFLNKEWDFNVANAFVGKLTFTNIPNLKVGVFDLPGIKQNLTPNSYKGAGDGYFDIQLEFETSNNNNGARRFTAGDQVAYEITSTVPGLSVASFSELSVGGNLGGYYSAAHIGGIDPGDSMSGWISPGAPVPEPATMLLLGSGLVGLAGFGRKKLFKKA